MDAKEGGKRPGLHKSYSIKYFQYLRRKRQFMKLRETHGYQRRWQSSRTMQFTIQDFSSTLVKTFDRFKNYDIFFSPIRELRWIRALDSTPAELSKDRMVPSDLAKPENM